MSEDWDNEGGDTSYHQPQSSSSGFVSSRYGGQTNGTNSAGYSSAPSLGAGRGRGRGRGLGAFGAKSAQVGGASSSNGFGSSGGLGSSGFVGRSQTQQNGGGDEWGDNNNSTGYGGTKSYGDRGGYGSSNRSGGSNRRGGGGGRACYNCGSEDHQKRDCPQGGRGGGGGGGGGRACYNCGSEDHQKRDCPQGGGGGGGGGECYKCHETGHFARECPKADDQADGQGGEDRPPASSYIPPEPSQDEEVIFATIQKGINFDKYDDIPVEVSGNNPPRCITSFQEADLYDRVQENVRKAKYDKPTPVQKYGIPIIGGGRDLMACAQTGSGKTAAFLLPILSSMLRNGLESSALSVQQCPQTIVVSPTRELAIQIYQEARKFSHNTMLKCVVVYGGTKVMHQLSQVEKGCNLLVATPGRLLDFIERGKIGLEKVQFLVLDEADRMLDMGFGPAMEKLVNNTAMPKKGDRQTLMFSATFPNEVQQRAADYLNDYLFLTVGRVGGANSDVKQVVLEVDNYSKRDKLVETLQAQPEGDRTLVFTETKRGADFLASFLSQSGFPTTSIHGDREQREREEALEDFKKKRAWVLVATSVAARGLDIPYVKHVVNYDFPSMIEDYVHRIGRTGRCGNIGLSTSFYDPEKDSALSRALIKVLADAQQDVPEFLEAAADSAIGTYHGNAGGRFGGRDTRSGPRRGGGGGGGGGGNDGFNSGGGDDWNTNGGGGGGGAAQDEEEWD